MRLVEPVVPCPEASALLCAASLAQSCGGVHDAQCLFQCTVVWVIFLCDTPADSSPLTHGSKKKMHFLTILNLHEEDELILLRCTHPDVGQ